MRGIGLLLVLLVAAPVRAERPAPVAVGLLAIAEASLVADALQSIDVQRQHRREQNPVIGPHPGDARIAGYFAVYGLATAAGWYVMPPRLRFLVPLLVLAVEIPQIEQNAKFGYSVRF